MSNPNSNNKRSQSNHGDDGDSDEREPKRAKDEHVRSSLTHAPASASSQAPAAMEEPLPLADSAPLPAPVAAEHEEAHALNATNLCAQSPSSFFTATLFVQTFEGSLHPVSLYRLVQCTHTLQSYQYLRKLPISFIFNSRFLFLLR
jgi:hypothetical protein